MCWWWGDQGIVQQRENPQDELSLEEWQRFIDSVSFFQPHIRITGGEPFLRADMFELVAYIQEKSLTCSFISNGTLFDRESITRLVELNVSQITFSLHGDSRADARVRGDGAFDKTIGAIEMLLAAKERLCASQPQLMINCVISRHNLEGLSHVIRMGQQWGVHVRLQHLIWYDRATLDRHALRLKELFGLTDPTLQGLVRPTGTLDYDRLSDILESEGYIAPYDPARPSLTLPTLNREGIRLWYTDPVYCGASRCEYVFRAGRVKANGEVIACPFINYSLGNIRERDFTELFQSAPAVRFRQIVSEELLPGCVRCCKLHW
jgi:MoaA/NifB/PqqE/SkfB family radical SAM enzyme